MLKWHWLCKLYKFKGLQLTVCPLWLKVKVVFIIILQSIRDCSVCNQACIQFSRWLEFNLHDLTNAIWSFPMLIQALECLACSCDIHAYFEILYNFKHSNLCLRKFHDNCYDRFFLSQKCDKCQFYSAFLMILNLLNFLHYFINKLCIFEPLILVLSVVNYTCTW